MMALIQPVRQVTTPNCTTPSIICQTLFYVPRITNKTQMFGDGTFYMKNILKCENIMCRETSVLRASKFLVYKSYSAVACYDGRLTEACCEQNISIGLFFFPCPLKIKLCTS